MKQKLKIGVLLGGPSAEREVSLVTGQAVYDNLDRGAYAPQLVELTKDCRFMLRGRGRKGRVLDFHGRDRKLFDIIFIALHGPIGEDGCVQGFFETLGLRYTGPGVMASALAMNKVLSGQLFMASGLPVPPFVSFTREEWKKNSSDVIKKIKAEVGFPSVIKPADQGSAVGVYLAADLKQLQRGVASALQDFSFLIAQQRIVGPEATCGVLEKDGAPFALPPTHIRANAGAFYDYASKYQPGGSTHICPADFSAKINKVIQQLAVRCHTLLNCRGMSRSDFMIDKNSALYILETNTIPGMTPTSLLPEAAGKAGITFSMMLDLIVQSSL